MELRRADFSLSDEQEALRGTYRAFLERQVGSEQVRKAEPLGFAPTLWGRLQDLRPTHLGLDEERGGDGAGLVELALVAEEIGRAIAPVPFVECAVAARLVARLDAAGCEPLLAQMLAGDVSSIALVPPGERGVLVPAGAVATAVLGCDGERVLLARADEPPPHVENIACAPLAWWSFDDAEELAHGPTAVEAFEQATREWRVLTAAALVGIGDAANALAVQYAKDRSAFGVPIGTFQSIANRLVDAATAVDAARRVTHKAAWFADNEPASLGARPSMAFLAASEAAEEATATAVHTQGGFGFTLESDVQLLYRRAKGWSLVAGDRAGELGRIADAILGSVAP
jgi:alkylation response protein AidB-like acyl-CoA dehydrogenase